MKKLFLTTLLVLLFSISVYSQNEVQIARLKYSGGGDWYNDPSGEVNLLKYFQSVTGINTKPEYVFVDINFQLSNFIYDRSREYKFHSE